jgi:hypothetical protein
MGHVTCLGAMRNAHMFVGSSEGGHLEDLGIDGRILKYVLKRM